MQLQQKLKEYEDRINNLMLENRKLDALGIERMREIEAWKVKYAKSDNQEVEELRAQLDLHKKANLVQLISKNI
jgi:hypothetical protein